MADLASCKHPKTPRSSKFQDFLDQEIAKQETESRGEVASLFHHIRAEGDYKQVLLYYGAFRHWGHPFRDYLSGLERLYALVTLPKQIDVAYARALARDLAYIVLHHEYNKRKKWFVDGGKLPYHHPPKVHIANCTRPTSVQIQDMGDLWADLPTLLCYEVPPTIDPSVLYADRSHSMDKPQVQAHIGER